MDHGARRRDDRTPPVAFRTTCPTCGEVDVDPDSMMVSILDADAKHGGYGFICTGCGQSVWKEGYDRSGALMLLIVAGLEPIQAAAERLLHDSAAGR